MNKNFDIFLKTKCEKDKNSIIAENLSEDDFEFIKSIFSRFGSIEKEIKINNTCYEFHFSDEKSVEKLLEVKVVKGRQTQINIIPNSTSKCIHFKIPSLNISESNIKAKLKEFLGIDNSTAIRVFYNYTNIYGFVDFQFHYTACKSFEKALLNPYLEDGSKVHIEWAGQRYCNNPIEYKENEFQITKIKPTTKYKDLFENFSLYGKIVKLKFGRNLSYGWIQFSSKEEADKCYKDYKNNSFLNQITLRYCIDKVNTWYDRSNKNEIAKSKSENHKSKLCYSSSNGDNNLLSPTKSHFSENYEESESKMSPLTELFLNKKRKQDIKVEEKQINLFNNSTNLKSIHMNSSNSQSTKTNTKNEIYNINLIEDDIYVSVNSIKRDFVNILNEIDEEEFENNKVISSSIYNFIVNVEKLNNVKKDKLDLLKLKLKNII